MACIGMMRRSVIMIVGPTASGKSSFALEIAKKNPDSFAIVNADSMQVYKSLPLVTASPTSQEVDLCSHYLYNELEDTEKNHVALWLQKAQEICQSKELQGKHILLVGGTGLYLHAFEHGLAYCPPIPQDLRETLRERAKTNGVRDLYLLLRSMDPLGAQHLKPTDTHRILRALEVMMATGKPLWWWQKRSLGEKSSSFVCHKILLCYCRDSLEKRARQRWHIMKEQGVIDQVAHWLAAASKDHPLFKAVGVRQIQGYLNGEIDQKTLDDLVVQASRRYIKRQQTWFKKHAGWHKIFRHPAELDGFLEQYQSSEGLDFAGVLS